MTRTGAAILALVASAMLASCGGKAAAPSDGSTPDQPVDQSGSDAGTGACTLAAQDCPSTADKCDFGCQGSAAVISCDHSADGGALGSACSAGAPCARGAGCLSSEDGGVACRKYCAGDADCAAGQRCHNVTVAVTCGGTSTPLALHYCY